MFSRFWPAPVPLMLGGRAYYFAELRVRDLAALETWARRHAGCPFEAVAEASTLTDPDDRRLALVAAYDLAEKADVGIGDDALSRVLGTQHGLTEQVWLSVRECNPGVDRQDVEQAVAASEPHELSRALAVAWGTNPLDYAQSAVDLEAGVNLPRESRPPDLREWRQSLWSLIEATGWTPSQIGDLHLSQWDLVRSGGESCPSPVVHPEKPRGWTEEEFKDRVTKRRAELFKTYGAAATSADSGQPPASTEPNAPDGQGPPLPGD